MEEEGYHHFKIVLRSPYDRRMFYVPLGGIEINVTFM